MTALPLLILTKQRKSSGFQCHARQRMCPNRVTTALLIPESFRPQFKKIIQNASALVILRFYQYRKLALLQQTWFKKQSPVAGSGRRGRSIAMAINMSELSACRVNYKKSLANLKRVMQAR
jgi:hypothetical protein